MRPYEKPPIDELYHHGILGMKWGKRNGPPYPLGSSDHSASEKRAGWRKSLDKKKKTGSAHSSSHYHADVDGAKSRVEQAKTAHKEAKKQYNKETAYGMLLPSEKTQKKLNRASREVTWAKKDVQSEKIKEKLNAETGEKSKRRLKLEEEYSKKGMTKEEAAIAAYKRERTEKILAVAGVMTVAAISAYVAYNHYDHVTDKIIDPKTILHNISRDSNKGVSDAFYAAFKDTDRMKYRGMYGGGQLGGIAGNPIYDTAVKLNGSLKVASDKNGAKVLEGLIKSDSAYAKDVLDSLHKHEMTPALLKSPQQQRVLERGVESLKKGKVDRHVWDAVNLTLTDHSAEGTRVSKKLYDGLKSAGYDAIMDTNDKRLSGYRSSKPVIIFNGASKTTVSSIRQLTVSEMKKDRTKGLADVYIKQLAPVTVGYAASGAAVAAGMKWMGAKSDDEIVRQYRKEHPNTELSYTEILRNEKRKK